MKYWIWGAGNSGIELYKQSKQNPGIEIEGFIDSNPALWGSKPFNLTIISPKHFSLVLNKDTRVKIAVNKKSDIVKIYNTLIEMGLEENQIEFEDITVRYKFLYYFAKYIYDSGIKGNVAECGVYRGNFAANINYCFYDRLLYLFDTFTGFDKRDISVERNMGDDHFLQGRFNKIARYSYTSVDEVITSMYFTDNVIIKQGWIPETFTGVTDCFCFVNLDLNLYQPTLESIKFFWDKMSQGGMILCHDYNSVQTPGVKKAIFDFEKQLGRFVPKTTIGDGLSAALIKA